MKFNLNGNLINLTDSIINIDNRAFLYGDFIREVLKVSDQKIPLWEEHYFNLMASLRIFRMKIPLEFTPEFIESEIIKTLQVNAVEFAKVEIIVFRETSENTELTKSGISYLIRIVDVQNDALYTWKNEFAEIEIFKDFTVNPTFFSQIRTHKPEEIIAQAYMQENEFTDLVLLNPEKRIARTLLGNPFLVQGNTVKTPKIDEGGIRSVLRNQLCKLLGKSSDFQLKETEIFPFELQKSDEVFICIEGEGLLSIQQNRKKTYTTEKTKEILSLLNASEE